MAEKTVSNPKARSILQKMAGLFCRQPQTLKVAAALNETRGVYLATYLEIADSGYARSKGLLGRDGLAPGSGLWIYPCESVHTFAMKFAIDLVYLDRRCVVKKTRSRVPRGRVSACFTARSVLELPAGTVEATQTRTGDQISIQTQT